MLGRTEALYCARAGAGACGAVVGRGAMVAGSVESTTGRVDSRGRRAPRPPLGELSTSSCDVSKPENPAMLVEHVAVCFAESSSSLSLEPLGWLRTSATGSISGSGSGSAAAGSRFAVWGPDSVTLASVFPTSPSICGCISVCCCGPVCSLWPECLARDRFFFLLRSNEFAAGGSRAESLVSVKRRGVVGLPGLLDVEGSVELHLNTCPTSPNGTRAGRSVASVSTQLLVEPSLHLAEPARTLQPSRQHCATRSGSANRKQNVVTPNPAHTSAGWHTSVQHLP